MCGICGLIDHKQILAVDRRDKYLAAMNEAISHRGPDDAGFYSDDQCHLAMRRLAIIDIHKGAQPVFNEQGNICVFFNGEIYNYREIKEVLLQKGHVFRTDSDTEVLVHAYEEYGEQMLIQLKGMFALCLYDIEQKSFLLARDRFGEKPLYYHWDQGIFSFSSEVSSLLKAEHIHRKLNVDMLPYYFRTSLIPEPHTLLEGVKSLNPGHFIRLQQDRLEIEPYFQLAYTAAPGLKTEEEAVEYISPILEKAVKRQTISDVPIGAFLSGGIDSSTVVALLQEQSSNPIDTFNVRFEEQAFDESKIARKVADFCGTNHHEITIPNYDFDESIFWEILEHVGLPFRDSSAIPTYLISKEIGKEVKVALSGDGGDELFGGYSLFRWYQQILGFQKIPSAIRAGSNSLLNLARITPGLKQFSKLRQIQRVVRTSMQQPRDIAISLNELFIDQKVHQLFTIDAKQQLANTSFSYPYLKTYPQESKQWSALRNIMYYRMQYTLPANMLVKVDRMSMAHSLEVRAPFLDPDLFQAAAQLPDDLLIRNGKGKYLIRKIMEHKLPTEVFDHPKMGFSIPLHKYQNDAFRKLARELLLEESPLYEVLNRSQVVMVYEHGLNTKRDSASTSVYQSAHQLWLMMQLFAWVKRFDIQV